MSTTLNGNKAWRPGSRVPSHLLDAAIRWEQFRASLAPTFGSHEVAMEAKGLVRNYERRLFEETDSH